MSKLAFGFFAITTGNGFAHRFLDTIKDTRGALAR